MIRLAAMFAAMAIAVPALAQDFNYTPGWSNTHNFNRLHERGTGKSRTNKHLKPCRFDMLPTSQQRALQKQATAKIAEVGRKAAMPWIDQQSKRTIASMEARGICRSR